MIKNALKTNTVVVCQLYVNKLREKHEGKTKTFPNKHKLREFNIIRPALQEIIRGVIQVLMSQH